MRHAIGESGSGPNWYQIPLSVVFVPFHSARFRRRPNGSFVLCWNPFVAEQRSIQIDSLIRTPYSAVVSSLTKTPNKGTNTRRYTHSVDMLPAMRMMGKNAPVLSRAFRATVARSSVIGSTADAKVTKDLGTAYPIGRRWCERR